MARCETAMIETPDRLQYCRRCYGYHAAGSKNCPCCCSECGGEIDSEGWCPNYCTDEK